MAALVIILSVSVYFNVRQRSTIADYKNKYDHLEVYDTEALAVMIRNSPEDLIDKSGYSGENPKVAMVEADIICIKYLAPDTQDCFYSSDITNR
jgi:hypothetical protein